MPEITSFLKKNRRLLVILAAFSLLAFSSGYVFGLEGREMAGDVEARAQSISYKKGYEEGESAGYESGLAEAKKEAYQESFRTSYKESYLEQFKKAGIAQPKGVSLP